MGDRRRRPGEHRPGPAAALAGVASFVAFFLAFARFFWRLAYVVDERGVSYRGASRAVLFRWEDIVRVEASPVPLGGWYVSTRRGGFVLSGFVDGRDRLFELILARAGLFPT